MKPLNGKGEANPKRPLTPEEGLRYAMSLPVSTTITGMEKLEILRQNLQIAQNFQPMSERRNGGVAEAFRSLWQRDGRFEHYKMSLQYDNPQARFAHGYPIDTAQNEVKQMIKETENTGLPYPEMKP